MKNYFYVFEGIDGCGKSTLIDVLKKKLFDRQFLFTKEPFGTSFNKNIKQLLYEAIDRNDHMCQYLLFAAERAYHIKNIINPYLKKGFNVISDRFIYSSIVYQGMNINENFIKLVYKNSNDNLKIKKIFFCKIPYKIALERIKLRNINDVFDSYYEDKLSLLELRYDLLFKNNNQVVVLDMTLPIELLLDIVMSNLIIV